MPGWTCTLFLLFTLAVLVGAGLFARRARWPGVERPAARRADPLAATLVFVVAACLLYN